MKKQVKPTTRSERVIIRLSYRDLQRLDEAIARHRPRAKKAAIAYEVLMDWIDNTIENNHED